MNSEVALFGGASVPSVLTDRLGGADSNDDLSAGVTGGFAVVSFRGGKWRIKHGGDEQLVVDDEGEAMPSLRALILKGSRELSKNYYKHGYEEGSTDKPDCFSMDSVTPDPGAPEPQAKNCATCEWNKFGSRITDSGAKAKACSDSRRLVVLPEGDLTNETYGGPMLLRVPPASLSDLANYGKKMKAKGFPYNTVITRIGFDPDPSYPKLVFRPVRPLSDAEAEEVVGLLDDEEFVDKMNNILAKPVEVETRKEPEPEPEPEDDMGFEEPPTAAKKKATAKKKTAAKKKAPAKKKAAQKPAPEPEPEEAEEAQDTEVQEPDDDELAGILSSLDNLS